MTDFRRIDIAGMDRIEPAAQAAPQLMWIDLADLVIDGRYQRPLARGNWIAIRRIAGNFRWARFSPIIVAPVEGGGYAIIDGQHRCHAAALCGFDRVPAMVALIAPEEQAKAFIEINTSQIRVSGFALYRAALTSGDDWAVRARAAVAAAGCRLMTFNPSSSARKPGEVYSIALIRSMIARDQHRYVTAGLSALMEFDAKAVANFSDELLKPWLSAVAEARVTDVARLTAVLRAHRPWLVLEAATRDAKACGEAVAIARRSAFVAHIRSEATK